MKISDESLGENEEIVLESENNHENIHKNLNNTCVKNVRIQNKLESVEEQVNNESNECEYVFVDVSQLNNLFLQSKMC